MTKAVDEKIVEFTDMMHKAVDMGAGLIATAVSIKTIEMMQAIVYEVNAQAKLCDRCLTSGMASAERMQQRLKLIVQQIEEQAYPTPMCKGTPEAIAHPCPTCGTMTRRVDQVPAGIQGSDLGRPKFVCPKCSPTKCDNCKGKGWNKGTTPGGTRVVRIVCLLCQGKGKR